MRFKQGTELSANVHMAIPVSITVEGANILTRNLIIFGRALFDASLYFGRNRIIFRPDNAESTRKIDQLLFSHVVMREQFCTYICLWANRRTPCSSPQRTTAHYYKQLTRMSSALAFYQIYNDDLSGALKRKESISATGWYVSQLYLASAVLNILWSCQPSTDLDYVKWSSKCVCTNSDCLWWSIE